MRWKARDREAEKIAKKRAVRKWHNWFAWYPVKIEGHYYWLTTVERKWTPLTFGNFGLGTGNTWNYRESALRAG